MEQTNSTTSQPVLQVKLQETLFPGNHYKLL